MNNVEDHESAESQLQKIKLIFDHMPYLAWLKDKNGKYITVNRSFEERYDVKSTEVVGKTIFDFCDENLAIECAKADTLAIQSKMPQRFDQLAQKKTGGTRWLDIYVAPIIDDQGEVIGTMGTSRKITKRKRLEIELTNQKKFLQTMIDTIPDLIFYKDVNSVFLGGNKAFVQKLFGVDEEEIIGKSDLDFVKDIELANYYREKDQEMFQANVTTVNEEKITMVDGCTNDFETLKTPFYDQKGNIAGLIGISRNISVRKKMEQQLKEQKEYAQLLLRIVPSGIFSIDNEGKITSWNERAAMITGYDETEAIGQTYCQIIHTTEDDRCGLFAEHDITPLTNIISSIKTKQGHERKILKKIALIKNELGALNGIIQCFDDITERQQAEEKLRASEEKFRQLAENIHEIFIIRDHEKILYVSPAYEKMVGQSSQRLLENYYSVFQVIYPDDRERVMNCLRSDGQNMDKYTSEEFRVIHPCGKILWVWFRSYPIPDISGSAKQKAISIVDITDRKHIEEQLLKREQFTQQELNLAARIQQESLPLPFKGRKVKVNSIFKPYQTVSGDLINYKWFEKQQKLRGYVVDVSGHGVSTALQTATVKMLLDNKLLSGKEIEEEDFQYINRRMVQYLAEESFAALLYFEFDFQTMILTVVTGGINLFFVAKPEECALVPVFSCYLGLLDCPDVQTFKMPFQSGEIYGMMSDGVSDLMEFRGLCKKENFSEYETWLEELAQSPERRDDFSVICIEILLENKETRIFHIQNDKELEYAQVGISEFIESHAPSCAGFLEVAVNEALNNGFRAGGRVAVKARKIGNQLIFRVKDNGPGFSTEKINTQLKKTMEDEEFDAEFDEILLAEGGRGILIMKMFCDRLIYNQKGNEVLLMKKI
ncbi:PAS domain S-box protein [Pelosinus sp. sgz500959]|uniref:SpoIIE family protein phosphatase n=1 Tax=Pelosinus sp. sgz500959 TaxID=3242472 RepID=UPI003670A999